MIHAYSRGENDMIKNEKGAWYSKGDVLKALEPVDNSGLRDITVGFSHSLIKRIVHQLKGEGYIIIERPLPEPKHQKGLLPQDARETPSD